MKKLMFLLAISGLVANSCKHVIDEYAEQTDNELQLRVEDYGPFTLEDNILHFEDISEFEEMVAITESTDSIGLDSVQAIIAEIADYTSMGEHLYDAAFFASASEDEAAVALLNLEEPIYHMVNQDGMIKIAGYFLKFDFENEECLIHEETTSFDYTDMLAAQSGDPEVGGYTFDDEGVEMIKYHIEHNEWVYGIGCSENGVSNGKNPDPYGQCEGATIVWQNGNQTTTNYRFRYFAAYHKYVLYFVLECQMTCERLNGTSWVNEDMDMRVVGNRKYKPKCKSEVAYYTNEYTKNHSVSDGHKMQWKPYSKTTGLHKLDIYGTFSVPSKGWWSSCPTYSRVRKPSNY